MTSEKGSAVSVGSGSFGTVSLDSSKMNSSLKSRKIEMKRSQNWGFVNAGVNQFCICLILSSGLCSVNTIQGVSQCVLIIKINHWRGRPRKSSLIRVKHRCLQLIYKSTTAHTGPHVSAQAHCRHFLWLRLSWILATVACVPKKWKNLDKLEPFE